ncbi:CHAT domain-containing protein [Mycena pura]|uniref:CHAT domain-containing protein n=1 Tax=Mycena pura TaxID=153505 RepID=A0AAD6V6P1_9AGAR|nr:CHAT domain-containing protein [Mycena pura]
MIRDLKAAGSLVELNTAIRLLHYAAHSQLPAHPRLAECLQRLVLAFLARFAYTCQFSDVYLAYGLACCAFNADDEMATTRDVPPLLEYSGFDAPNTLHDSSEAMGRAVDIFAHFNQSPDPTTLDMAISIHREALSLRAVSDQRRWTTLEGLSDALLIRYRRNGQEEDLDEALALLEELQKIMPNRLVRLCAAHLIRFATTTIDASLSLKIQTIVLFRKLTTSETDALELLEAGTGLLDGFRAGGNVSDLHAAISMLQKAEDSLPWGHSQRRRSATSLANALRDRFGKEGDITDADKAIALYRDVLTTISRSQRGVALRNLANALSERFYKTENMEDLEGAIALRFEALALETLHLQPGSDPDRADSLSSLADLLHDRFTARGDIADLDSAVGFHREVLYLRPVPHPDRDVSLHNLASALQERFLVTGVAVDLDTSIKMNQECLRLRQPGHPSRGLSLRHLGGSLRERFQQRGVTADLDNAIQLLEEAVRLHPIPHPDHPVSLNSLSTSLHLRFANRGEIKDLDKAVELRRSALDLPMSNRFRPLFLNNLGNDLYERFEQGGDPADLDDAIELYREALALWESPHPRRGLALSNLASDLYQRYEQRGDAADLDRAIELNRDALALHQPPHTNHSSSLNNLAANLCERFDLAGDIADLDGAIELHQQALALRPGMHSDRASSLSNLANSLSHRFGRSGDLKDFDVAEDLHRQALKLRPGSHPDRGASLTNLANLFSEKTTGSSFDERTINLLREALALREVPHPDRGQSLRSLGRQLMAKHQRFHDSASLQEAVLVYREGTNYAYSPVSQRFRIALAWANSADQFNHDSALEAYRSGIELLPQFVMLGLDVRSRLKALTAGSNSLVANAAACAIRAKLPNAAIEFLEMGRSVFWSRALQLRTPIDDLWQVDPKLAEKVSDILRKLEHGAHRDLTLSRSLPPHSQHHMALDAEARRYRDLDAEWLRTLENVRRLKGFSNFLQPKPLTALRSAAKHGPVIVLNASKANCTALIVTSSNDVQCVQLPDISLNYANALVILHRMRESPQLFFVHGPRSLASLQWGEDSGTSEMWSRLKGSFETAHVVPSANEVFGFILGELWRTIVKPVFVALKFKKTSDPPRVWWCPTGLLSFLPIHAAGIYDQDATDCTSEYAISSYTPTLSALMDAPVGAAARFKMTAIIQPETADLSPLPATRDELKKIKERVPKEWLTSLGDTSPATVDTALLHLRESSIVHFACHGVQDLTDPLESGLVLSDGRLRMSAIMHQPEEVREASFPSNTRSMSLAFLSACETAKGDDKYPDEAMHLAATLLFAGFRGVVATMWSILDPDGPKVAEIFYEHLFKQCRANSETPVAPDLTEAARALHLAVTKLREDPTLPFARWVPFVHYGL